MPPSFLRKPCAWTSGLPLKSERKSVIFSWAELWEVTSPAFCAVYLNSRAASSQAGSSTYRSSLASSLLAAQLQITMAWRLAPGIGSTRLTNVCSLPLKRAYFGNGCSMAFSLRYLGSAACCRVLPRVARRRAGVCAKGGGLPGGGPPLCCG